MSNESEQPSDWDIEALVVGGGLVGSMLGIALAGAGVSVLVVDRSEPEQMLDPALDGRATAIAHGSANVLRGIGVWQALAPNACPIDDIRVAGGGSALFLHYDHRETGDVPLGHIIENAYLREALQARAAAEPALTYLAPAELASIERTQDGVSAQLADGRRIRARLLLACDGRNSEMRRAAGIPVTQWSYRQSALVCSVFHDRPHRNVAHELFLPGGPFAILPMTDRNGRHRSGIVWSERSSFADILYGLDDKTFVAELAQRFGDFLGPIALAGPRWSYPLALSHATRYADTRLALVGDAAHAIHPLAGQGLNMGIRDVAALAELLVDARRLGRDIGDPDLLAGYERWRRFDNMTLAVMTDSMNRLFSNDIGPLRQARNFGLAAVNAVGPLRRSFMRHAMGVVGDLPRLVRGENL